MRILVVEDQEETARILKEKFEAECYAVDIESDGERGSYRARTNDYDLILLDNMLPGKEGSQICRELRSYKMTTPIMILSVRSEVEEKIGLLNCGADDYLTKPFSFAELSARVKALLRRPKQLEDECLTVGDLSLDRKRYCAFKGNSKICLTPKEFSLLEYFMKNPGQALTRGRILEHIWDESADPFSNSLETHIMNLRKKLDPEDSHKYIHTIPGRGYKMEFISGLPK